MEMDEEELMVGTNVVTLQTEDGAVKWWYRKSEQSETYIKRKMCSVMAVTKRMKEEDIKRFFK